MVLDLDLPRLSGEEMFEVMREIRPEVPVLIASAYLDEERVRRLEAASVAGFMSKPVRRARMLSIIADCLGPVLERGAPLARSMTGKHRVTLDHATAGVAGGRGPRRRLHPRKPSEVATELDRGALQ